jgi:hypothetical protein
MGRVDYLRVCRCIGLSFKHLNLNGKAPLGGNGLEIPSQVISEATTLEKSD